MDSRNLTPEQIGKISAKIAEMVKYLHALEDRMDSQGFPRDDVLYRMVYEAHTQLRRLETTLFYRRAELARKERSPGRG